MRIIIATFALLLIFTTNIQAQTEKKDTVKSDVSSIKYRAELGYGQNFLHGNYSVTSSYHVIKGGVNVEIPLNLGFGVETGLRYSVGFGKRNQVYAHNDTAKFSYTGHYIDIPLRANYTLPIFWGLKLFAYAGPTFNIGLVHKENVSLVWSTPDPAPTNPLNYPVAGSYNSYAENLNRFNIQLGAGGGLQWRNYRIKSGYDWGLNNLSKDKNRPQRAQGWYVAFEYEF